MTDILFYYTFLIRFRMIKNMRTAAITLHSHSAWEGVSFKPEIKQMNQMHLQRTVFFQIDTQEWWRYCTILTIFILGGTRTEIVTGTGTSTVADSVSLLFPAPVRTSVLSSVNTPLHGHVLQCEKHICTARRISAQKFSAVTYSEHIQAIFNEKRNFIINQFLQYLSVITSDWFDYSCSLILILAT